MLSGHSFVEQIQSWVEFWKQRWELGDSEVCIKEAKKERLL